MSDYKEFFKMPEFSNLADVKAVQKSQHEKDLEEARYQAFKARLIDEVVSDAKTSLVDYLDGEGNEARAMNFYCRLHDTTQQDKE